MPCALHCCADSGLPLWLGEGGAHNGGGGTLISSRFLPRHLLLPRCAGRHDGDGHFAFGRQTLAGGNYELLRCSSAQLGDDSGVCDFEPRPSYYVALLWRRLMDSRALSVGTTAKHWPKRWYPCGYDIHHCQRRYDGPIPQGTRTAMRRRQEQATAALCSVSNSSIQHMTSAAPSFLLAFNSSAVAQLGKTRLDFLLRSKQECGHLFANCGAERRCSSRVSPGDTRAPQLHCRCWSQLSSRAMTP